MLKVFHPDVSPLSLTDTAWPDWLGVLHFSTKKNKLTALSLPITPLAHISMQSLGRSESVWQSVKGMHVTKNGQHGDVHFRHNEDILFAVITLDETNFPNTTTATSLQLASKHAYSDIFATMQRMEFPHLLRCWNYFADINGISHDLERYRQFNLGRQQAFEKQPQFMAEHPPAACALGTQRGPLTIAFVATRKPPIAIQNPRQIDPRDYPPEYGPRSPLFSRACLSKLGGKQQLFLSGTASIAGHQTLHVGDVIAQTEETILNIRAVLDAANAHGNDTIAIDAPEYVVYIRHAAHLPLVRATLEKHIGSNLKASYLQADICRAELLLEIEGFADY